MHSRNAAIAQSRYRQLRLTVTHEISGRLSYSVYAKQLNAEWRELHCIARGAVDGTTQPLTSTEDVLAAIVYLIEDQWMLPADTPL